MSKYTYDCVVFVMTFFWEIVKHPSHALILSMQINDIFNLIIRRISETYEKSHYLGNCYDCTYKERTAEETKPLHELHAMTWSWH